MYSMMSNSDRTSSSHTHIPAQNSRGNIFDFLWDDTKLAVNKGWNYHRTRTRILQGGRVSNRSLRRQPRVNGGAVNLIGV